MHAFSCFILFKPVKRLLPEIRRLLTLFLPTLLIATLGCSQWKQVDNQTSLAFPKTRIAPDAVGLELAVAQIDSDQAELFESFWNLLDSQELPLAVRQRLDQNGIRAAVMASHPPSMFHEIVGDRVIDVETLSSFEKQLHAKGLLKSPSRMIEHARISNREGQGHPIQTSAVHPEISWVVRSGTKQTVGSAKSVLGVMTVTTYPQGDGSVRLVLRPEIHHGQSRTRIGVAERSFLVEESQSVTPVDELKLDVTLRSGESIVLAPTSDVGDVGKVMFGVGEEALGVEKKPYHALHRMLLIRVVQTQMDDLFSNSNLGEKLTTTPRY
jgi:hypothetical protein